MNAGRQKKYTLVVSDEVRQDLLDLPSQQLQKIALYRIEDLVYGKRAGDPLGRTLEGLFKVYFDVEGDLKRYRIVYQFLPPARQGDRRVLHVVAVGPREDFEVYARAAERLGRRFAGPRPDEAKQLERAASAERAAALKLEREAKSRQDAVDHDRGPAVSALRALGKPGKVELGLARAADNAAISTLLENAREHREAARLLRAQARDLKRSRRHQPDHPHAQTRRSQDQQPEPYSPPDPRQTPPGPSRNL